MKYTDWYNDQINKYTFIKSSIVEKGYFHILYENESGKEITKTLSVRTSVKLLQEVLERIKTEVGEKYENERGKIEEITISICAF